MDFSSLISEHSCPCGKEHRASVDVVAGRGALLALPSKISAFHAKHLYCVSDLCTASIAEQVTSLLEKDHFICHTYRLPYEEPKPNEATVGAVIMHLPVEAELLIGIGSGVINDVMKIVSQASGKPYIVVATAPSMDGYASASSSMTVDGQKLSLPSRLPDVIIGDTEILKRAPTKALLSGLGDMLAKYVSLCEWRISRIINGEYYCDRIAELVRTALTTCVGHADGLLLREDEAIEAVFNGLVLSGLCLSYAGQSRPVSGVEHYISHIIDMRHVALGTPEDRHGIQCAVGTLIAVKAYEKLLSITPDEKRALEAVEAFSFEHHAEELRSLLGSTAEKLIEAEYSNKKYDRDLHRKRLPIILSRWEEIVTAIREELPSSAELEHLFDTLGLPKTTAELGTEPSLLPSILRATADVRDKYILPRLLFDLGLLQEFSERMIAL